MSAPGRKVVSLRAFVAAADCLKPHDHYPNEHRWFYFEHQDETGACRSPYQGSTSRAKVDREMRAYASLPQFAGQRFRLIEVRLVDARATVAEMTAPDRVLDLAIVAAESEGLAAR